MTAPRGRWTPDGGDCRSLFTDLGVWLAYVGPDVGYARPLGSSFMEVPGATPEARMRAIEAWLTERGVAYFLDERAQVEAEIAAWLRVAVVALEARAAVNALADRIASGAWRGEG